MIAGARRGGLHAEAGDAGAGGIVLLLRRARLARPRAGKTLSSLGTPKRGVRPTVYHFPQLPFYTYTNMPSCFGQWSATCL